MNDNLISDIVYNYKINKYNKLKHILYCFTNFDKIITKKMFELLMNIREDDYRNIVVFYLPFLQHHKISISELRDSLIKILNNHNDKIFNDYYEFREFTKNLNKILSLYKMECNLNNSMIINIFHEFFNQNYCQDIKRYTDISYEILPLFQKYLVYCGNENQLLKIFFSDFSQCCNIFENSEKYTERWIIEFNFFFEKMKDYKSSEKVIEKMLITSKKKNKDIFFTQKFNDLNPDTFLSHVYNQYQKNELSLKFKIFFDNLTSEINILFVPNFLLKRNTTIDRDYTINIAKKIMSFGVYNLPYMIENTFNFLIKNYCPSLNEIIVKFYSDQSGLYKSLIITYLDNSTIEFVDKFDFLYKLHEEYNISNDDMINFSHNFFQQRKNITSKESLNVLFKYFIKMKKYHEFKNFLYNISGRNAIYIQNSKVKTYNITKREFRTFKDNFHFLLKNKPEYMILNHIFDIIFNFHEYSKIKQFTSINDYIEHNFKELNNNLWIFLYDHFLTKSFLHKDIETLRKIKNSYNSFLIENEINGRTRSNNEFYDYLELETLLKNGNIEDFSQLINKLNKRWEKNPFRYVENIIIADLILRKKKIDKLELIKKCIAELEKSNETNWFFRESKTIEERINEDIYSLGILRDILIFENSVLNGLESTNILLFSKEIVNKIRNSDHFRLFFLKPDDIINHYSCVFYLFRIIEIIDSGKIEDLDKIYKKIKYKTIIFPEWKKVYNLIEEYMNNYDKVLNLHIYKEKITNLTQKYPIFFRLSKSLNYNMNLSHSLYDIFYNKDRRSDSVTIKDILPSLIEAIYKVQIRQKDINVCEDSISNHIVDHFNPLVQSLNIQCLRNPQAFKSRRGKSPGIIDFWFQHTEGKWLWNGEALIIKKLKNVDGTWSKGSHRSSDLLEHYNRLIEKYDLIGKKQHILLIYVISDDFEKIFQDYKEFLQFGKFCPNLISFEEETNMYEEVRNTKILKSLYKQKFVEGEIYHILSKFS